MSCATITFGRDGVPRRSSEVPGVRSALAAALVAGLSLAGPVRAQGLFPLSGDSVEWTRWERPVAGDKRQVLLGFGLCVGASDSLDWFHFMDFDGDGFTDLVFSGGEEALQCEGPAAGAYDRTILYRNSGGQLRRVFFDYARVVGLGRAAPWQPVELTLRRDGCCGDPYFYLTFHRPVTIADSIAYVVYDRVSAVKETELPQRMAAETRGVRVARDRGALRAAPVVDDTTADRIWPGAGERGNVLAEYGRGAVGLALAEQRDAAGGSWLFVVMGAEHRPLKLAGVGPAEVRRMPPTRFAGWVSASHLEPVPRARGRPDSQPPPLQD